MSHPHLEPFAVARLLRPRAAAVLIGLTFALAGSAQVSPEEHAKHHPGQDKEKDKAGMPGMGGGMMGGGMDMGKMMEGMMGKAPPKELYPTLMSQPELTPEQREHVRSQADGRMRAGVALLSEGLEKLAAATEAEDYAAMQEATAQVREAVARFESGLAARRALAEGKPPRQVAMQWFKAEMNLQPPQGVEARGGPSGLSVLHYVTMALLAAFAAAMLAMYYFKMRRAATLFGRLEPDTTSPPGPALPPDGGAEPPPPPDGKGPLPGGKDPPTDGGPPPGPGAAASPPRTTAGPSAQSPGPTGGPKPTANPAAPVTAKWRGPLGVESIVRETPDIKTFRLRSPGGGPLPFTFVPGQFLNVALGIGGARMNRSYSISSSPNERDYVELSVKREARGAVSRHIVDLWKVGDAVDAGGPVGKFTFTGTEAGSVVLISAGVGVTPMVSIARYLTEQAWPGDIFFIFTCRNPADYVFEKTLAALAIRNPKLHVVVAMTKPAPDWTGPRGRVTKELLAQSVPDIASRRVHICGPVTMMEATTAMLRELGVPDALVKSEAFGAVKPPPAGPTDPATPTVAATGPEVTFSTNHKAAKVRPGQTILELSEQLAIGIENSCRVGTCGICKVKMTAGEVEMAVEDSLDADEKAAGVILACQAIPKTAVTVEA